MVSKKENYQETTLASSKEAQGSKPNPLVQLDPGLFIWTILTFLLLCFALAKFAWKPLLKALESRENDIQASIEDAKKAKSELENLNQEAEKIIAEARSKAQEIRIEAKTSAEKIRSDVQVKAEEDEEKAYPDCQAEIGGLPDHRVLPIFPPPGNDNSLNILEPLCDG